MERAVTYVCKFVSVAAHSDVLHQYLRRDLCNTILKMKKIIYDFRVTPPPSGPCSSEVYPLQLKGRKWPYCEHDQCHVTSIEFLLCTAQ